MFKSILSLAILTQFFIGCGTSDSASGENGAKSASKIQRGIFVLTKPVANLHYSTTSFDNYTNDKGEYQYYEGEDISFDIAGVALGTAPARPTLTPFNLVPGATTAENSSVTSGIVLLMSLDSGVGSGDIITLDNAVKLYQFGAKGNLSDISSVTSLLSTFSTESGTKADYSLDTGILTSAYDYVTDYLNSDANSANQSTQTESSYFDDAYNYVAGLAS